MITPERLDEFDEWRKQNSRELFTWQQPQIFPGSPEGLRMAWEAGAKVVPSPDLEQEQARIIAESLFKIYHPKDQENEVLKANFVNKKINSDTPLGSWVLFCTGEVERFPEADDHFALLTSTQRGLGVDWELAARRVAKPLIAGLSVGAAVADRCASVGFGNMVLTDPKKLEDIANFGRNEKDVARYMGAYKVDAAADVITRRNPYMKVTVFREGVTAETLPALLACNVTVAADEMDDVTKKPLLNRLGVPIVSAADVGMISQLDTRDPKKDKKTFNGRMTEAEARQAHGLEGIISVIGSHNVEPELLKAFAAYKRGDLPHVAQHPLIAALGGVLATYAMCEIAAGRDMPTDSYHVALRKVFQQSRWRRVQRWLTETFIK